MRKWNTESFSKKVKEICDEYELVDEYENYNKKIKLKHNICGHEYKVLPHNFVKGVGWCSYCAQQQRIKTMTKTTKEFKEEVAKLSSEYEVLSEYTGANRKILFKHSCGNFFTMTPSNFLQGQRCPKCFSSESRRHTKEQVQEIINERLDKSYELISDYKNNHTKIEVKHHKCNNIWYTTLRGINGGNRCPFCTTMTKGEERVLKYLLENGYDTKFQKTYEDCKRKEYLPFDFYIEKLNLLIEYDGIFHYEPIYGEDVLKRQQENDEIKNQYAKNNNINLLRIPYWDFENIEKILEEELNKY